MSFFAALWILVSAALAGAFGPTPAPHGVTVPPAAPAPASVVVRGDEPRTPGHHPGASVAGSRIDRTSPSPAPAAPTVAEPPDVAEQLPEEVIGRQIDCPDGSAGTVSDAAGDVVCP